MKKISRKVGIALLGLFIIIGLSSAIPVEAKPPVLWEIDAWYTFDPEWTGDIYRDDGSHGMFVLDLLEARDLPDVQHSSGVWSIVLDNGEYLMGEAAGHVVWSTGEYVLNGMVTDTSSAFDYLNGRQVHIEGYITPIWTTLAVLQIN